MEQPQRTGITQLAVAGYKSISKEQSIEVRPLTILAGANSSGKSSMLQPLLLLKQTLEAPFDPGALLLNGPNVKFTSAEQVLSRSNGCQQAQTLSISSLRRIARSCCWECNHSSLRATSRPNLSSCTGSPGKTMGRHR